MDSCNVGIKQDTSFIFFKTNGSAQTSPNRLVHWQAIQDALDTSSLKGSKTRNLLWLMYKK